MFFYHQADVCALLGDVITIIVVVGITTLLTVALECVPIGVYFVLADVIDKMADVIAMERRLLADFIAMWLVLLPLLFVCLGRCYSLVTDVIAIIVVMFGRCCYLEADGTAYCGCGWQME